MVSVTTQRQLRAVRGLPFCHVCGKTFGPYDDTDYDHVPPQTCFDVADRNPPLKLKTHVHCNNQNKLNDEKVGQLIAAQRNKSIDPSNTRLNIRLMRDQEANRHYAGIDNLDVEGAIRRWVGGFHSALYQRPLHPGVPYSVSPPLPRAKISGTTVVPDPVLPQHAVFVEALKLNRAAHNLDTLVTNAEKLRYECVWAQENGGPRWFCIFALDLYGWIDLGDKNNFQARGCVGAYLATEADIPPNAARATRILARVENRAPLDPFGP